jgi:hypothetical protein
MCRQALLTNHFLNVNNKICFYASIGAKSEGNPPFEKIHRFGTFVRYPCMLKLSDLVSISCRNDLYLIEKHVSMCPFFFQK